MKDGVGVRQAARRLQKPKQNKKSRPISFTRMQSKDNSTKLLLSMQAFNSTTKQELKQEFRKCSHLSSRALSRGFQCGTPESRTNETGAVVFAVSVCREG